MARPKRGQGTVRQRGGRFQATIQIEGLRHWQSFELEADAWSWVATVKADAVRGLLGVEAPRLSVRFDDLCDLYKVHKLKKWRPGTVRFFDGHVEGILKPQFQKRLVGEITTLELQRFLDGQLERIATRGPRPGELVSPTTVGRYAKILAEVFRYAVRMSYLEESPMARVERVKPRRHKPRILRLHELQALFTSCPEEHRPFLTILALTGLRKSELFRMRWDWCDFESDRLLIREAKCHGEQELPMSERVREALEAIGPKPAGHVFPGTHRNVTGKERVDAGKPLKDKRIAIRSILDAAKVDPAGVAFHTFRRSFVTLLDGLPGVPYGVVRALARHTDTSADVTTRYLHPSQDQLRVALAELESLVFGRSNVILFPKRAAGE